MSLSQNKTASVLVSESNLNSQSFTEKNESATSRHPFTRLGVQSTVQGQEHYPRAAPDSSPLRLTTEAAERREGKKKPLAGEREGEILYSL
ncbi:hypothetical protein L484_017014 [Morus notabilis]|uniref:Uncharacterized protein n=1 Tax=Morus notabilis TaxID=981085 RepID=W9RLC7_9ROSA|nr:hypothetical protein L484_017014 [Morus notabilis]